MKVVLALFVLFALVFAQSSSPASSNSPADSPASPADSPASPAEFSPISYVTYSRSPFSPISYTPFSAETYSFSTIKFSTFGSYSPLTVTALYGISPASYLAPVLGLTAAVLLLA